MAEQINKSELEKAIRQKLIEIESREADHSNIDNLKKLINLQLTETGIHSKVLDLLSQQKQIEDKPNANKSELKKEELYTIIKKEGVLDEIFRSFSKNKAKEYESKPVKKSENFHSLSEIHKSKIYEKPTKQDHFLIEQKQDSNYYLKFKAIKGKAFVEYLLEPAILSGQSISYLLLYIYFCGQRFQSQPTPATCEPEFSFDIKLLLHKSDKGNLIDSNSLLSKNDPIHIILIKVDSEQNPFLVSSYFLEWRQLLTKVGSKMDMAIELPGIGVENKVPAGMLELYLELQPPLTFPLQNNLVSAQLSLEHSRRTERDRLFLAYAKLWWKEYIEIRPDHTQRLVKIFAQDENAVVRPVFSYVHPITTNRLLETPREVSWFVSLFKQNLSITYSNIDRTKYEQWKNLSTFLCLKEGDYEDHSVLLCSLLLGFGLDAYVCLGTSKKEQPCSWVMTIGRQKQVMFWNSLTAARYKHVPIIKEDKKNQLKYPYKTIGCIFNNNRFFANCQPTDAVELCSFDLENSEKWKAMSPDAMELIASYIPTLPVILPSSLDSLQASYDLEEQLKHLTTQHRKEKKLSCFWDDKLCHLLTSALANYENQGKIGMLSEDEDFHDAIYRVVPEGHTFKALPVHFLHRNAKKIFYEILQSPLGQEIICCQGDMVRIAIRARVYTYVEDVISVWVMFAVKYKPAL